MTDGIDPKSAAERIRALRTLVDLDLAKGPQPASDVMRAAAFQRVLKILAALGVVVSDDERDAVDAASAGGRLLLARRKAAPAATPVAPKPVAPTPAPLPVSAAPKPTPSPQVAPATSPALPAPKPLPEVVETASLELRRIARSIRDARLVIKPGEAVPPELAAAEKALEVWRPATLAELVRSGVKYEEALGMVRALADPKLPPTAALKKQLQNRIDGSLKALQACSRKLAPGI